MNATATPIETNPYSPPQARVADVEQSVSDGLFFVVAPRKFLIMMIGTTGLYSIYWFYKNWSLLNRKYNSFWPVARAIFAVFFVHSLFGEVDQALRRGQSSNYRWSPGGLATTYVISAIVPAVLGQVQRFGTGQSPPLLLLQHALFGLTVYVLYRAQLAVNLAEGDPQGSRNNTLTLANFAWLALGAVFWFLLIFGFYLILTGRALR